MSEEKACNVTLSDSAIKELTLQLEKRTPNTFLRLGVRSGGCSGFIYVLQFEDSEPKEKDLIFKFGNIKVVIDNKSIHYLNDIILDWESTLMRRGFKFLNPNEKSKCGCSLSFFI